MTTDNQDQIEYWNGETGQKWARQAMLLDGMLQPFAEAVQKQATIQSGDTCLDIGCGAGALTLAIAEAAGGEGKTLGVDVSTPLIQLAQTRAIERKSAARFLLHDAATYGHPKPVDKILSRFGVMFFTDPAKAFATIRTNIKKTGTLTFACWQGLQKNDWAMKPLQAALPFLKEAPTPPAPHAPGPFAFDDKDYLLGVLKTAGWGNITIETQEHKVTLPGETPEEAAKHMLDLGPVARLLQEQELSSAPVQGALATQLTQYQQTDGKISLGSAIWLVSAAA